MVCIISLPIALNFGLAKWDETKLLQVLNYLFLFSSLLSQFSLHLCNVCKYTLSIMLVLGLTNFISSIYQKITWFMHYLVGMVHLVMCKPQTWYLHIKNFPLEFFVNCRWWIIIFFPNIAKQCIVQCKAGCLTGSIMEDLIGSSAIAKWGNTLCVLYSLKYIIHM